MGIGNQTYYEKLLAGRPNNGWILSPFEVTDGAFHVLVPAVAGMNHIITDVLMYCTGPTKGTVAVSDTVGVVLFHATGSCEQVVMPFVTHCIVSSGRGIRVRRVAGDVADTQWISIIGYTEDVEAETEPTIYTGV